MLLWSVMTIMMKDSFKCIVIGDTARPRILLMHGMGFLWKKCFREIIDALSDKYCIIIPEAAGHHNVKEKRVHIDITDIAEHIENYLKEKEIGRIDVVYGISFGATVAAELVLRGRVSVDTLVVDGAQFVNMGVSSKLSAFVMAWQFMRLPNGRHMNSYVRSQLGYGDRDEIKILSPLMCDEISFSALYRSALVCYMYDISKRGDFLCDVIFMYGADEQFAAKSEMIVRAKTKGDFQTVRFHGMGHAEALSTRAGEIAGKLSASAAKKHDANIL